MLQGKLIAHGVDYLRKGRHGFDLCQDLRIPLLLPGEQLADFTLHQRTCEEDLSEYGEPHKLLHSVSYFPAHGQIPRQREPQQTFLVLEAVVVHVFVAIELGLEQVVLQKDGNGVKCVVMRSAGVVQNI